MKRHLDDRGNWTTDHEVQTDCNNTVENGQVVVFQRIALQRGAEGSPISTKQMDALARKVNPAARLTRSDVTEYKDTIVTYRTYTWGTMYRHTAGDPVIRIFTSWRPVGQPKKGSSS